MEELSPAKIDHVIADCVNSSNEEKSTRIGLFEQLLKTGIIPVNEALPIAIKEIKSIVDISIILICLRHGADPNLYINVKGLGPAHIIIYAFYLHFSNNRNLFNILYNFLVLRGSSTRNTSYEKVVSPLAAYGVKQNDDIKMESVYEWLINNSKGEFQMPSIASEIFHYITSEKCSHHDKEIYSVFLNDTTICKWTPDIIPFLLYTRNPRWKSIEIYEKDSIYLKIGFNATFSELVIQMLDDGLRPSYLDFTFWIAHYKHVSSFHNDDYLIGECEKMIIELVRRGYQIDLYCLDEIGSINSQFRTLLMDEYQRPLYTKVCSHREDGYIPDEMRDVAIYLGIPEGYDKEIFCNSVEHITSAELESVVKANQKRNSYAIGSKLNFLTDFINSTGLGSCDNRIDFNDNPLDYPNSLLAYYKDTSGKTWCFLSKDFEKLLHTKLNPTTKTPLPGDFLNRVATQTEVLKFFNFPLNEPKTISKILNEIKKSQLPTNTKTDEILTRVRYLLDSRGLSEEILTKRMTINEIIGKFNRIGIDICELLCLSESEFDKSLFNAKTEFSPKMCFIIMCNALDVELRKDITLIEIFLK